MPKEHYSSKYECYNCDQKGASPETAYCKKCDSSYEEALKRRKKYKGE